MSFCKDRKSWVVTWAVVAALLASTCVIWNGSIAQEPAAEPAAEAPADAPAVPAAEAPAAAPDEPGEAAATEEAAAEEAPAAVADGLNKTLPATSHALDTIWVMLAGFLVMWMQAGFALVETGLTRAKNAVNICMKNLLDYCFGSITYWLVGFSIMFANGGESNGIWGGLSGMMVNPDADWASLSWTLIPLNAKFFFQLVFAATTATIVSGAMAERTKFTSYMIYSAVVSAVIYPVSGHWIWGGGWLATNWNFFDFAGSTVVHSVGGWLSLIGAFILGPRIGKYGTDGSVKAIPGHNLVLVALGVFILWLGWFGFNPGSTMSADPNLIANVTINTNAAAAIGCITALMTARIMFAKWEATMALNGALAGLVAITCPCAWVTVPTSFIIGGIAGVLVVLSVVAIDRYLKVDDPGGAISVHGVCGAWGTLSLGLFSTGTGELSPFPGLFMGGDAKQLIGQAVGVGAAFVWAIVCGAILFTILKVTVGLRVTPEEEHEGLDFGEHGNEAYHGFQFVTESHV